MPVVTRSRSKRGKRGSSSEPEGFEKTPRRSARIAAARKRAEESSSDEGRQTSMTPSMTPVKNPGQEPKFSGITLGSDTLEIPMQFFVPEHVAESAFTIRTAIRRLSESPFTLKNKNNKNKVSNNNHNNHNLSYISDNDIKSDSDNNNDDNNEFDNNNNNIENKNDDNNDEIIDKVDNFDDNNCANRFGMGTKPSRVPTFDENTQSWSFEPETEVPQLARNLLLFIITVSLVVLAVVYKEQLSNAYDQYMPPLPESVSSTFNSVSESVQNAWTSVVDTVSNAIPSQNDSSVTDATDSTDSTDSTDAAVNTGAADVMSDSATETVTNE